MDGPTIDELRSLLPSDVVVGVTDVTPFDDVRATIEERVVTGKSGGLGFVYRDPSTASEPHRSFPWAHSIVVVAVPYLLPGDGVVGGGDLDSPSRSVARFADGDRYERVERCLTGIGTHLASAGHRSEVVFDDDRLVDRAIAQRAGIGWSGKSTMLITPSAGPWVLIGSVVTDARIASTEPMQRTCGTCTACIPACPTAAIVAPGVLDARRCLAAVLQRPGTIPRHLRPHVGGRVYGCDDCLVACPPGDKVLDGLDAPAGTPDARRVLSMSDAQLAAVAGHWYVPHRSFRFVRRNALVALGNTATRDDVPVLIGYLGHPDPLLRAHAAWALGACGGVEAQAGLAAALDIESDLSVVEELGLAMG